MPQRIPWRNDTAANWTSNNPVLAIAEPGLEYDSGKFKFGDGLTAWNSLAYAGNTGAAQTFPYRSFGDGGDGNVTVSTAINLSRDMFYNNLTLAAGGTIYTLGWRIFVKGVLDLRTAGVSAIFNNGQAGQDGSGSTGGVANIFTGGVLPFANTIAGGTVAGSGGNGGTAAGSAGTAGGGNAGGNGGANGAGAVAGAGPSGAGGASGGAAGSVPQVVPMRRWETNLMTGITLITGGSGGRGGGGGGGDSTNAGGGGGGGGAGGGVLGIWANTILKGPNTPAGAISSLGGNGGNGANGPAGNTGGGGGGSGGGGGWVYIACINLFGNTIQGLIDVSGGLGGNGGSGLGTGAGGNGAGAGGCGTVTVRQVGGTVNLEKIGPASTTVVPESLGNLANGIAGGSGGFGTTFTVTL